MVNAKTRPARTREVLHRLLGPPSLPPLTPSDANAEGVVCGTIQTPSYIAAPKKQARSNENDRFYPDDWDRCPGCGLPSPYLHSTGVCHECAEEFWG